MRGGFKIPAVPAIALALTAAASVGGLVEQNQVTQHAKGAAEAQATATQKQIDDANAADAATKKTQAQTAQAGAAQKMAAALASMTATGGGSGTITGAGNAPPAPTAGKTLLGV